jgi:hypothetical protein
MSVINGCSVAVDTESTVSDWLIDYDAESTPIAATNTQLGLFPVCGVYDWIGSYSFSGHTPAGTSPAVLFPGYTKTFTGSVDGRHGVEGSAIGKSLTISANPGEGVPINTEVEFDGNGLLSVGGAVATDATKPQWFCPDVAKIQIDGYTWADVDDIVAWKLKLTAANTPYVSTGTSKRRQRIRGPFGGVAQVNVFTDDPTPFPEVGDYVGVRFFVTATLYWEVLYMRLRRLSSNPTHPAKKNEPVTWTLLFEFSSFDGVSGNPTVGHIKTPAGVTVWPYPA